MGSSPLAHGRYLHGSGSKGYVTVALKISECWRQHSYPVEKIYEVLSAHGGMEDVYISQNRFYGSRSVNRLAELSALYGDVDYYKLPELSGRPVEGVLDLALEALIREQIPYPSLAMATGRGLALVWRHEPVPAYALPKWERCQERIFEALKDLGADPMAKSAAQVLRLAGTYNSKSGALVESIFENLDDVWEFGELADEVLPLTSEELEERRVQQRLKIAAREARADSERPKASQTGFTLANLCEARLRDLESLMELRGLDTLPPGERDAWMFVAGVSLSYLVEPGLLEKRLLKLGRERASWSEAETRSRMQTVISRAHSAAAGETVQWSGQQRHPRYWISNKKIIDLLGITPDEETRLETIISKETKGRRDKERKERERRALGLTPRSDYIAHTREQRQHNRHLAKNLHAQGLSLREIGRRLGISHTQVRRLLLSSEAYESGSSE